MLQEGSSRKEVTSGSQVCPEETQIATPKVEMSANPLPSYTDCTRASREDPRGFLLNILEGGESGYSLSTSIGERSVGPLRRNLLSFILAIARAENRMKSASFVKSIECGTLPLAHLLRLDWDRNRILRLLWTFFLADVLVLQLYFTRWVRVSGFSAYGHHKLGNYIIASVSNFSNCTWS